MTKSRKQRGRGEGSVGQQGGRWFAYLSVGYDGQGKRVRKRVYADTKQDAQKELHRLQTEHAAGRLVSTEESPPANISDAGSTTPRRTTSAPKRG